MNTTSAVFLFMGNLSNVFLYTGYFWPQNTPLPLYTGPVLRFYLLLWDKYPVFKALNK